MTGLRLDVALAETTWEQVAGLVLLRPAGGIGNGNCERCGGNPPVHPHHRWLKSQGGLDVPSNLAALDAECHRWCHENPDEAARDGWIVQAPYDFRARPVRLWNGILTRLDDFYGYDVIYWAA